MIMQSRQVNRFLKLFDSFMSFCAKNLDVPDLVAPDEFPISGQDLRQVIFTVWGEEGGLFAIDRYLEANPDKVNRTDLREVESWKAGLFGDYSVIREGGNVYFMMGGYAFAVRGLYYEADDDIDYMPAYAVILLLPFDGIITYGLTITCTSRRLDLEDREEIERELDECKTAGHIVRSARQFIQVAPLALAEELRHREEESEDVDGAPQFGPGTHEGALVGLTVDERSKAIDDYLKELRPLSRESFARVLEQSCYPGEPTATLREFLSVQSSEDLKDLMVRFNIVPPSRGGKTRLIRELMNEIPFDGEAIEAAVCMAGSRAAEGLRDCYRAGGRITVPEDEVTSLDALPPFVMPYLMVFHDGDEFCAQIFEEAMPTLGSIDVDKLVEKARAYDAVIDCVSLIVDFRGVVETTDAIMEANDIVDIDFVDPERLMIETVMLLGTRGDAGRLDFTMVPYDEGVYLTAYGLLDVEDMEPLEEEDEKRLSYILADQAGREPRPVGDLLGTCRDAFEWMSATPEFSALVAFLDAHVPDGANDYLYADKVLEDVFEYFRLFYPEFIDDALDAMAQQGYVPADDEERDQVGRLLMRFYGAVPKWQLNGWSLDEAKLAIGS